MVDKDGEVGVVMTEGDGLGSDGRGYIKESLGVCDSVIGEGDCLNCIVVEDQTLMALWNYCNELFFLLHTINSLN